MFSRFSDILGLFLVEFPFSHLHGRRPAKNPQTWGLVGGQLEHDEWWIYDSQRVSEDLRQRVLRRAALREALEEMGGVPEGSKMPYTPIIFEPLCVQVAADGQAMRLPRQERRWPVPAGLSFLENDPHRSKQLRVENSHTYVFVYLFNDSHRAIMAIGQLRRVASLMPRKTEPKPRRGALRSALSARSAELRMVHLQRPCGDGPRTLLTLDPDLLRTKDDRSFVEIVKEEVRSRMGIPNLRQKLFLSNEALPLHASWADLGKPREIELHIMDYVDSHGAALRQMAEAGKIQQAEACLMLPQEPNSMDRAGETAALKACRRGHMEMMQLLCYADADMNLSNNQGETPLMLAAQHGHQEIVEFLLENDVEKDPSNCWGETPVFKAAERNHHEILRLLLEAKARKEKQNLDGATPLKIAAARGNVQCITLLLRVGASKNKASNDGATPLFVAAQNGHRACVYSLLQAGADRHKATNNGQAPLFAAVQAGHVEVVKLLVEGRRGDKEARYNGATALYVASLKGYVAIVNVLVEGGADLNGATPANETPLFVASLRNQDEVVKVLLRGSADVNKATSDGATPLLVAAQEGHMKAVKLLLEAGADHCLRMSTGETALALAKDEETKELFWTTRTPLRPGLNLRGPNVPNALRMGLAV
ncbi:unnamed protein product [Cladocopium goreaui]|uniref:Ankyrin-1 (ANK-1) (Ankyrin-R) (Erythrocyte ankyrin) n=1 Tax=Cladocopium goreaui TaxID=2562237 RepID=A0A9P1FUZ9_9DINO|nr:unnamed protein product [Cladocopium goreaui]